MCRHTPRTTLPSSTSCCGSASSSRSLWSPSCTPSWTWTPAGTPSSTAWPARGWRKIIKPHYCFWCLHRAPQSVHSLLMLDHSTVAVCSSNSSTALCTALYSCETRWRLVMAVDIVVLLRYVITIYGYIHFQSVN